MSVIRRLHGFSVKCDTCGAGGFVGTGIELQAVQRLGLMQSGFDENGNDQHKCANGCVDWEWEREEGNRWERL